MKIWYQKRYIKYISFFIEKPGFRPADQNFVRKSFYEKGAHGAIEREHQRVVNEYQRQDPEVFPTRASARVSVAPTPTPSKRNHLLLKLYYNNTKPENRILRGIKWFDTNALNPKAEKFDLCPLS